MADHITVTEKLHQMSLNLKKGLSAVLQIDILPADSGKLFLRGYHVDRLV
jgi:hypothetical protein